MKVSTWPSRKSLTSQPNVYSTHDALSLDGFGCELSNHNGVDRLTNMQMAIGRYHRNAATLFTATSAFFARDNVALPGVALNFKANHKFFQ